MAACHWLRIETNQSWQSDTGTLTDQCELHRSKGLTNHVSRGLYLIIRSENLIAGKNQKQLLAITKLVISSVTHTQYPSQHYPTYLLYPHKPITVSIITASHYNIIEKHNTYLIGFGILVVYYHYNNASGPLEYLVLPNRYIEMSVTESPRSASLGIKFDNDVNYII